MHLPPYHALNTQLRPRLWWCNDHLIIFHKWYANEILLLSCISPTGARKWKRVIAAFTRTPLILVSLVFQDSPRWIIDEQLLKFRLHALVFIQPLCISPCFHTAVNIYSLDKFISCVHLCLCHHVSSLQGCLSESNKDRHHKWTLRLLYLGQNGSE